MKSGSLESDFTMGCGTGSFDQVKKKSLVFIDSCIFAVFYRKCECGGLGLCKKRKYKGKPDFVETWMGKKGKILLFL